ncbi:MAG: OsmC family protein [Rubrivivax sp.]|jgi:organic hydroperoxide reductase OsmC/OhrA
MSRHACQVQWQRADDAPFVDNRYSRRHVWRFDGGTEVPASSSPQVVRVPMSDPAAVDPEEAFVAALSSCHMLWFLNLAALAGWCVESYTDDAEGHMRPGADGKPWMAEVLLRPHVTFAGERLPDDAAVQALHHRAHDECFLARSVKSEVRVEPAAG